MTLNDLSQIAQTLAKMSNTSSVAMIQSGSLADATVKSKTVVDIMETGATLISLLSAIANSDAGVDEATWANIQQTWRNATDQWNTAVNKLTGPVIEPSTLA